MNGCRYWTGTFCEAGCSWDEALVRIARSISEIGFQRFQSVALEMKGWKPIPRKKTGHILIDGSLVFGFPNADGRIFVDTLHTGTYDLVSGVNGTTHNDGFCPILDDGDRYGVDSP